MNNKSAPIPEGTRPEIERFLRRLGYRLVIRTVQHEASVSPRHETSVTIQWENVGVAPPYRDYRVAVRLSPSDRKSETSVFVTDLSTRGWLPGLHLTEAAFRLPPTARAGRYEVALSLVDPGSQQPAVRLAILGRDPEGWYPVSHLDIVP